VQQFNSSFTASTVQAALRYLGLLSPIWLRLVDDGTDRHFRYSADGVNFLNLLTHARTTVITPTHYGLAVSAGHASYPTAATFADWSEA
jgi:hypothetical protein